MKSAQLNNYKWYKIYECGKNISFVTERSKNVFNIIESK